jgi:orotate phosphoribosyltransferase
MSTARQALIDHLRTYSLRTDGPFTLASGHLAAWYMDARRTTFSGGGAVLVAAAVLEALDPAVQAIGGMTMGADPIAIATATMSGGRLDAFSIRKEAKDHGTGGRLVGPVGPGTAVAVLEDTTTTGAAFLAAVDVAQESGLRVVQTISLFDRSAGTVEDLMASRSLPYTPLVLPADLGVSM